MHLFKTMDDFEFSRKRVLVRVDMNSPLDRATLKLKDVSKIASTTTTLKELSDKGAKVAVLAHQGRKGHWDYIDLDQHAEAMSKILSRKVSYVDDLTGESATAAIDSLKEGEIIVLKNVRSFEDEDKKLSPEHHSQGALVKSLAHHFDIFVNDAFASAHRSHASLVGFTAVLPSAAGRLMEKEIRSLSKIVERPARPCVIVFGGTKFIDSIPIVRHLLEVGTADKVLLGGLVGLAYHAANGKNVGAENQKHLQHELSEEHVSAAKEILAKFPDRVLLPVDMAVSENGRRVEHSVDSMPDHPSLDIGSRTMEHFGKALAEAKTILISGPVGVFEKDEFAIGTRAIFERSTSHGAFCIIGGGHTTAAANQMGFTKKISYISTGGGALENFLMGKPMPVIEALKHAAQRCQ